MNEQFQIALLLVTGDTPKQCLTNAHVSEKEAQRLLENPALDATKEFSVRLPGDVDVIVSPLKDARGWGLWRAYVKPTFDTEAKATDFGVRLMEQLRTKGRASAKRFTVIRLAEQPIQEQINVECNEQ